MKLAAVLNAMWVTSTNNLSSETPSMNHIIWTRIQCSFFGHTLRPNSYIHVAVATRMIPRTVTRVSIFKTMVCPCTRQLVYARHHEPLKLLKASRVGMPDVDISLVWANVGFPDRPPTRPPELPIIWLLYHQSKIKSILCCIFCRCIDWIYKVNKLSLL